MSNIPPRSITASRISTTPSLHDMTDMDHSQALLAVAIAELDVKYLTEKFNDFKDNIVEFKGALDMHSVNIVSLNTEMALAPFEAKLKSEKSLHSRAQQGLSACETSIDKALYTAMCDLKKAEIYTLHSSSR